MCKANFPYYVCVVTWHYQRKSIKGGFLVDFFFFFFFTHHNRKQHSRKFGPHFLTVITLRLLFVLVKRKSSTNDSDFELGHRWITFLILC